MEAMHISVLDLICFILQTENAKDVNGMWKRKNGLIQRESPPGQESPQQVDEAATASLSALCMHREAVINIVFTHSA